MKLFIRLNQQLNKVKKNNKGAGLVSVLLVASIVAIFVTVVLAIVLLNVYMKKTDREGQMTFYDAESAMEEIKAGLSVEASHAAAEAYVDTLTNYTDLRDDAKTDFFNKEFLKKLNESLQEGEDKSKYSTAKLESFLKETKMVDDIGANVITKLEDAHINETSDGLVLKNVIVKYVDKDDYATEIMTDIVLEYPPIDFKNASAIDNVITYALVANDSFEAKKGSNSKITGNAYLGTNGANISGTNITFANNSNQEGNVISGGNINLKSNAKAYVDDVAMWADSIVQDNSYFEVKKGSTYIKNDIVLGNNSRNVMAGKLIMFGNPWVAINDDMVKSPEVRTDAMQNMPEYSSSILVDGANAGIDLTNLNTMVIGGSAYIDAAGNKSSNASRYNSANNSVSKPSGTGASHVVTGQSMALKSDQRAYLVPATLIGAGTKGDAGKEGRGENYENGFSNPMTSKQYQKFQQEIMEDRGYSSVSEIKDSDMVNFIMKEPTLGVSLREANSYPFDSDIKLGYENPSFKVCAYPMTSGGAMIYFFIDFKMHGVLDKNLAQNTEYIPAEAFYNHWYRLYNSSGENMSRLMNNLDYYATYGIKLPKNVNDKTCMYFTGNILTNDPNKVIVPDIITQSDFSMAQNYEYSNQSAFYQDAYYTIKKNLSTVYSSLDSASKNKELFDNIINSNLITKTSYYVARTGESCVVTNGDYTYNNTNENILTNKTDVDGNKHKDAKINLIIAKGDVTVSKDFEGVIIAGGKVSVDAGVNITANPSKSAKALVAPSEGNDDDTPAQFVTNASHYLVGGVGKVDNDTGNISFSEFVTYRNWTKLDSAWVY